MRGGRDEALQLKYELRETTNLAMSWVVFFASRLTQEKQQETNSNARKLTSETIAEIFQFAFSGLLLIASMGTLESLSIITLRKPSSLANWTAQRIAAASATSGSTTSICLIQAKRRKPVASRATTAMKIGFLLLPFGTSILGQILIQVPNFLLFQIQLDFSSIL